MDNESMDKWRLQWTSATVGRVAVLVMLGVGSGAFACDEALNPQSHGDWDYTNSPLPIYLHCHPASSSCQLPIRLLTPKESDLDGRAAFEDKMVTRYPPVPLSPDVLAGSEIGKRSSLNDTSVRNGPDIKDCP
jgi:hypothetical protein